MDQQTSNDWRNNLSCFAIWPLTSPMQTCICSCCLPSLSCLMLSQHQLVSWRSNKTVLVFDKTVCLSTPCLTRQSASAPVDKTVRVTTSWCWGNIRQNSACKHSE